MYEFQLNEREEKQFRFQLNEKTCRERSVTLVAN
jgi:hypothetical protein